jgi:hypothetical protein
MQANEGNFILLGQFLIGWCILVFVAFTNIYQQLHFVEVM